MKPVFACLLDLRARRELAAKDVELGPDGTPVAFRIWKQGPNPTDKGTHVFSQRSAKALMAEQDKRGNLYSIDFDHASLSTDAPPEARRAAGWHRLAVRDGELWAIDVQWTDVARAGLTKEPPEFRYFSPAYSADAKTDEIVEYLNTALTNNPATWEVTALASRVSSQREAAMADDEKKSAEGEGKDEAAAVLAAFKKMGKDAALAAIAAAFPDDEKKSDDDDEKKKDTKAAESSDEEPEKKADTIAATREAELMSTIGEQDRRLKELEAVQEKHERAKILAARPDLTPKQLEKLANKTAKELPELLDLIPIAATKTRPNLHVEVDATRGEGQAGNGEVGVPTRYSDRAAELDRKMGFAKSPDPVKLERNVMSIGVMTRAQATEHLKQIEARRAVRTGGK